jgi:uncharacterized protein (DUF2141 family)/methionine-rich copper-binding protein CopC
MRSLIIILILIAFVRCANQTSPGGGPQDKKAPELVSSKPKNNQRNFKGEQIELTFDELIKLKDPGEEIMISPSAGKETKFLVKKNKLVIVPKNKLLDSTTYNISFRDAVQDLNEGNPIFNLRLAFSTGENIDSLYIEGSIYELFKEEIPEKITVALYQSDTFNIFNHQPFYFTRTDKTGKFTITNLKPGQYYIYAFEDKSKNLKVESKTEKFGFISKPIQLIDSVKINPDSLAIPLIRVDARPIKITSIRHTKKISRLRINKPIRSVKIQSEYRDYFLPTYGDNQDEIAFYGILKEQPEEDSIKIQVHLEDSVGNSFDTTAYLKSVKGNFPKETFKIEYTPVIYDFETKSITTTANFNKPIGSLTLDSIYLQIDSTNFQTIKKEEIKIDTLAHRITLNTVLNFKKPKEGESPPSPILIFGKGAFISIESDSSKARTDKIRIQKEEELGSLAVEIATKKKDYLLQLLSSQGKIIKSLRNPAKYTFKNLEPQEYKIRIIIDSNKNGIWDTGNFETKREPEHVIIYKSMDKKTSIPVRANWEVGPLVIKF